MLYNFCVMMVIYISIGIRIFWPCQKDNSLHKPRFKRTYFFLICRINKTAVQSYESICLSLYLHINSTRLNFQKLWSLLYSLKAYYLATALKVGGCCEASHDSQ